MPRYADTNLGWRTCRLPGCYNVFRPRRDFHVYCCRSHKNRASMLRRPQAVEVHVSRIGDKVYVEIEIDAKWVDENKTITLAAKTTAALFRKRRLDEEQQSDARQPAA